MPFADAIRRPPGGAGNQQDHDDQLTLASDAWKTLDNNGNNGCVQ